LLIQKYNLKTLIDVYKLKYNLISDSEISKYLIDFFQADIESDASIQLINYPFNEWEEVKKFIQIKVKEYIKN